MKIRSLNTAIIALVIFFVSCSNQKKQEPITQDTVKKNAPMQMLYDTNNTADRNIPGDTLIPAVEKKYLLSSGILTMKIEVAGMKSAMNSMVYFDHFGNREATETINTNDLGNGNIIKSHHLSFNSDGYIYQIDLERKTGTKSKYDPKVMTGGFSFAGLTDNMKKQYNIKKEGTSVVLGKQCDLYSMNSKDLKGKFAVWKNLTLNLTTETGGITTRVTTTKLQENVPIPKEKFSVPPDITIVER
jgi:hypothetical protein